MCVVAYASLDFVLSAARYTQGDGVTRTYAVIDTEDGTYTGPLKKSVYEGTGAYEYKIGSEEGKGKPPRGIYVGAFIVYVLICIEKMKGRMAMGRSNKASSMEIRGAAFPIGPAFLVLGIMFVELLIIFMDHPISKGATGHGGLTRTYAVVDSDNGTYFGPLVQGRYKGTGTYVFKTSQSDENKGTPLLRGTYVGQFDDTANGEGVASFEYGRTYRGTFKDGKLISGTYVDEDGKVQQGNFSKPLEATNIFRIPMR